MSAFSNRLEFTSINNQLLFADPVDDVQPIALNHHEPHPTYPIEDRTHIGYEYANNRFHLPELRGMKSLDGHMLSNEDIGESAVVGPDLVFERGPFVDAPPEPYNLPANTKFFSNYYNVFSDGLKKQTGGPSQQEQREGFMLKYEQMVGKAETREDPELRKKLMNKADNYLLVHSPELFNVVQARRIAEQQQEEALKREQKMRPVQPVQPDIKVRQAFKEEAKERINLKLLLQKLQESRQLAEAIAGKNDEYQEKIASFGGLTSEEEKNLIDVLQLKRDKIKQDVVFNVAPEEKVLEDVEQELFVTEVPDIIGDQPAEEFGFLLAQDFQVYLQAKNEDEKREVLDNMARKILVNTISNLEAYDVKDIDEAIKNFPFTDLSKTTNLLGSVVSGVDTLIRKFKSLDPLPISPRLGEQKSAEEPQQDFEIGKALDIVKIADLLSDPQTKNSERYGIRRQFVSKVKQIFDDLRPNETREFIEVIRKNKLLPKKPIVNEQNIRIWESVNRLDTRLQLQLNGVEINDKLRKQIEDEVLTLSDKNNFLKNLKITPIPTVPTVPQKL